MTLAEHPAAAIFPLMSGADFDELVADVKANGLRDPIKTWHDTILDGRNRLRACQAAGIEPRFEEWTGDDPVAFVISCNLHRRHLNAVQRAAIAAKLENLEKGRPDKRPPVDILPVSRQQASDLMQVSRQSTAHAKVIYDRGTPEQIEWLERGKLPLRPTAEAIRRMQKGLPPKEKPKFAATTQRNKYIATAAHRRMVQCLSTINGACDVLKQLDPQKIIAASDGDELKQWIAQMALNRKALREFSTKLSEVSNEAE